MQEYSAQEIRNTIAFIEEHTGEKWDWDYYFECAKKDAGICRSGSQDYQDCGKSIQGKEHGTSGISPSCNYLGCAVSVLYRVPPMVTKLLGNITVNGHAFHGIYESTI